MQINPYLFYNGNCAEAFDFYAKVLGGTIEAKMTYADAPADMPMPPEDRAKVMHASMRIHGQVLMASDAPAQRFHTPQGFAVSLQYADPAEGERIFTALADGGSVGMPFGVTFWSKGFGMCVDRFGIPWMVNCPE